MNEALAMADELLSRPDARTHGLWPRAAAILGRQALEEQLLVHLGEELGQCSLRAQFLLLEDKLGRQRAGELAFVYDCLSEACHYHPYQGPPTQEELRNWFEVIRGPSERPRDQTDDRQAS